MAFQVMPGVLATVQICLSVREKREARRLRKHSKPAECFKSQTMRDEYETQVIELSEDAVDDQP